MGVLVKEITQKLYGGQRGKTRVWHMRRGDAATSSTGHLSLALEVWWEKALASASHMTWLLTARLASNFVKFLKLRGD